jgi:hypothetical protein
MLAATTGPGLTPPTPAAPLPAPPVRVGSYVDAKALRRKIQQLLAAIGRADEHVRCLCQTAREKQIYLLLEGPTGAYFRDWTEFVSAPVPWGLGLDAGLLEELARERSDPRRLARLALEGPLRLRPPGGQPGPRVAGAPRQRTSGSDYRLQRLKRDRPDLLRQLASGELPSVREAWHLAGLRSMEAGVLLDPQNVARLVVTRLTPAEQQEVLDLLQHPEQITPPRGRCPHWVAYRARTVPPEVLAREARERAERRAAKQQRGLEYARERRAAAAAARQAQAAPGLPSLARAGAPA